MQKFMFLIGIGLIGYGYFLFYFLGYPFWITSSIGIFNIILGVITPSTVKVSLDEDVTGEVKMVVAHAQYSFSDYELVFTDTRMVMKRLARRILTSIWFVPFAAIGGLGGGLTGLSVEAFLHQRKRGMIRKQTSLLRMEPGDLDIPYAKMSGVQLTGVSLKLNANNRPMVVNLGAEYPPLIARKMRELIPRQYWLSQS